MYRSFCVQLCLRTASYFNFFYQCQYYFPTTRISHLRDKYLVCVRKQYLQHLYYKSVCSCVNSRSTVRHVTSVQDLVPPLVPRVKLQQKLIYLPEIHAQWRTYQLVSFVCKSIHVLQSVLTAELFQINKVYVQIPTRR